MTLPSFGFVGTGHATTPAWPAGYATGDLGILYVCNCDGAIATPTGFTHAFRQIGFTTGLSTAAALDVFYKFATSTSETAPTLSGGTSFMWGVIATYSGVNAANPIHVASTGWSMSNPEVCPGLTTHLDDCLIVDAFAGTQKNVGPIVSSFSNDGSTLSSHTKRYDAGTTTGHGGVLLVFDGGLATKGQAGITRVTPSVTGNAGVAKFALQAATQSLGRKSRLINTRM